MVPLARQSAFEVTQSDLVDSSRFWTAQQKGFFAYRVRNVPCWGVPPNKITDFIAAFAFALRAARSAPSQGRPVEFWSFSRQ